MNKLNNFYCSAMNGLFDLFQFGTPAQLRLAVFIGLLIASACFGVANQAAIGSYLGMAVILTVLAPDIRESFRFVSLQTTSGSLLVAMLGFATFPIGVPFVGIFTLIIGLGLPKIINSYRSPRQMMALARKEAKIIAAKFKAENSDPDNEVSTDEPKVISKTADKNFKHYLARRAKGKQ